MARPRVNTAISRSEDGFLGVQAHLDADKEIRNWRLRTRCGASVSSRAVDIGGR